MKIKKWTQFSSIKENFEEPEEEIITQRDIVDDDLETPEISDDIESTDMGFEEEGHEYEGTKLMKELASKLNVEVIDNQINYNGVKVNYFSETESFHIGKKKFKTVDEAFSYLTK